MAARSRSVGRYDLVVEVAKSQLGSLWIGTALGSDGLEPRLIRCLAVGPSVTPRDVAMLADVGRWCSGFALEQAASTLDVVSAERELALVIRYNPGETLRSLLRLASVRREPVPTPVALRLVLDVCTALSAAASRAQETARGPEFLWGGLLPESILVGTDGVTRVLELGVAPAWRRLAAEAQHAEVVAYSAPEQLGSGQVAASSDVFTLGIFLWEMLSGGKRLFGGAHGAIIEKLQQLSEPPVAPGSPGAATDADTRALLSAMLEPDPERRLASVLELERVLFELGDRVAPTGEVADFVQRLAQQSLESRERVLGRALQRGAAGSPRRPVSEPPPPEPPIATSARPEALVIGAAKPLPLPAQVKLGARLAENRLPPPPPLRELVEVDTLASDDDDSASVRAEDIMAALAIEDLEPESDTAASTSALEPPLEPAAETPPSPALASAPTSSRRAPLTAVVVPSVVAGPDAPTLTPVPSVLETLRGQGFELANGELGLELSDVPALASATQPAPIAAAPTVSVAEPPPVPTKSRGKLEPSALGLLSGARPRVSTSLVAVVGGTLLLLLIAVVSTGGGGAAPAPRSTIARTENGADVGRQIDAEARRETTDERIARADTPRLAAALADPDAREAARVEGSGGPPAAPNGETPNTATATLAAAPAVAAPRVAAPRSAAGPRPARRSSAVARTTPAAKKKKLRATKTYIPAGI